MAGARVKAVGIWGLSKQPLENERKWKDCNIVSIAFAN